MSEIRITDPKNKAESHVFQNHQRRKRAEIIRAVKYCQENNCKGWKALKDLNLKYVKSPLTINKYLSQGTCAGKANNHKRYVLWS